MDQTFGLLGTMAYPGRILLIGRTDEDIVVAYGVTARSHSSQSKEYVFTSDESAIEVRAIDEAVLAQGNLDLLTYTAFSFVGDTIIAGNGRQTHAVTAHLEDLSAQQILESSLQTWSYENDVYNTPRITGLVSKSNDAYTAALHIIRSGQHGEARRDAYEIPLTSGSGALITTYQGENVRPTPAYHGQPFHVPITLPTPEELVRALFHTLAPQPGEPDLRVSIMSVYQNISTGKRRTFILNHQSHG